MFLISILQPLEHTGGTNNLIAQGIGMVGLVFAIFSFQNNKRHLILIFLGTAQIFFTIHFALLGVWTAVAMNIVGMIRTFSFLLRGKKKWMDKNTLMYVFIGLFCIAGALSWKGWLSLLPIMAMNIETIGLWNKNPRLIRYSVIIPRPLWIIYSTIHRSYAGVMTELFVITSLLTAIVRFDILPRIRERRNSRKQDQDFSD